jgi:hypothetical protein
MLHFLIHSKQTTGYIIIKKGQFHLGPRPQKHKKRHVEKRSETERKVSRIQDKQAPKSEDAAALQRGGGHCPIDDCRGTG